MLHFYLDEFANFIDIHVSLANKQWFETLYYPTNAHNVKT